jgi:triosephosphate isomerase
MIGRALRPLLIGNWKMHLTVRQAAAYLRDLLPRLPADAGREVAVAPPFTALAAAAEALAGGPVRLAAQDLFWEDEGPYTGEVSPTMLQDLGVAYAIVGHSERRQHLGETDLIVNRKVRAALRSNLRPVICVGEQQPARDSGRAPSIVRAQLLHAVEDVPGADLPRLAIAYEPVWAIGTGKAATPRDAAEMHAFIRRELELLFGEGARRVRVLYGGSVTGANIDAFMAQPEIDGALVGGASLRAEEFARIVAFRETA